MLSTFWYRRSSTADYRSGRLVLENITPPQSRGRRTAHAAARANTTIVATACSNSNRPRGSIIVALLGEGSSGSWMAGPAADENVPLVHRDDIAGSSSNDGKFMRAARLRSSSSRFSADGVAGAVLFGFAFLGLAVIFISIQNVRTPRVFPSAGTASSTAATTALHDLDETVMMEGKFELGKKECS